MTTINHDRVAISQKIRHLRQERRWTQAALAKLLELSQNRLSELERGQGSFTAEQLLAVLTHFNVPIDYFSAEKKTKDSNGNQLQNALARLGASHLYELETLPSDAVKDALSAIRETLVGAGSSRQITGIAPVIAKNIRNLNLYKLRAQLAEAGLERRLGWVLENTLEAIRRERKKELPREWTLAYRQAEILLEPVLSAWKHESLRKYAKEPEDLLDGGITSQESLDAVHKSRSDISKRWRIITEFQVDDFARALEAAR
ncbi:MAG TPA: helix-turn-helix transcriptional regulator [Elusimicrobiota bacterium]|nr:helix-turn-helix transcriptional regulator [Elusimicrobiota bacterium]